MTALMERMNQSSLHCEARWDFSGTAKTTQKVTVIMATVGCFPKRMMTFETHIKMLGKN